MVGNVSEKSPTVLSAASSKPTPDNKGARTASDYAKLATYVVNVRSFHPNKYFERLGFRFHGDERGFSPGSSWFGGQNAPPGGVTSRVWQRYHLDTAISQTGDITQRPETKIETESNPSAPGPGKWSFWGMLGHTEEYTDEELKPRDSLMVSWVNSPHGGQKEVSFKSWYGGENHAFPGSVTAQKKAGTTFVPTLDVNSEIFIRVERVKLYMDVMSLVYGDGFPNTESFIQDNAGNVLFLGSHVRIGVPATHLGGGNHERLMWANMLRVEITPEGNFGERLWVFTRVLGGSPARRDEYPVTQLLEICSSMSQEVRAVSNPVSPTVLMWPCGKPKEILNPTAQLPLHLSAFTPLAEIRSLLMEAWKRPPSLQTSRTEWNRSHIHRDPNQGRAADDYDVAPEKWQK